jgi:hypothetical protein
MLSVSSNLSTSKLLANFADVNTMISSNIYLLHELIDRLNVSIVDSNGKIDWVRLKTYQKTMMA